MTASNHRYGAGRASARTGAASAGPAKRYRRSMALGELTAKAGGRTFRKRGFVHVQILTQWRSIVGTGLGSVTAPERLSFPRNKKTGGTLMVRADGAAGLELQHHQILIIERINRFFGYSAVNKITIRQGPVAPLRAPTLTRPPAPKLDSQSVEQLNKAVKDVQNEDLRAALQGLGAAVLAAPMSSGKT